jgi:hypothetical protein
MGRDVSEVTLRELAIAETGSSCLVGYRSVDYDLARIRSAAAIVITAASSPDDHCRSRMGEAALRNLYIWGYDV